MQKRRMRMGDILVNAGLITEEQVQQALEIQKVNGQKLGTTLIEEGFVTEKEILSVLQTQLNIPFINLDEYQFDSAVVKLITEDVARKHKVIPLTIRNEKLVIATSDPLDIYAIDDVALATGKEVVTILATSEDINLAINRYYDSQEEVDKAIKEFSELDDTIEITGVEDDDDLSDSPIVRLVNTILQQAVKQGASDIHIEPFEDRVRIRFRIDGELVESMGTTRQTLSALTTRIKIIGQMNISERRRPQDGRLETTILGKAIDMRISVIPTVYGEKVVIRLLDRASLAKNSNNIQLSETNQVLLNKILKASDGMILVTGPTGSGKTTTLYSILKGFNQVNRNIITVEDPVEYRIEGINQVQTNDKAGLTFATSLRSILRQDPDVVMVGEIRDADTAEIACRAAITGHIVLSTLHTNDAASAVIRLTDMNIEPYLVSSAVVGIVAQRLVKKVCPNCRGVRETTQEEMDLLGIDEPIEISVASGCNNCNHTGYKGRTPIHEILTIDQDVRRLINNGASADEIKDHAQQNGMKTLKETCLELVEKGITTVEELVKFTYTIEK